jgi:hypothetical protein
VGVWGSTALVGQKSRAGGSEIPWGREQRLCGPMERDLACSACYSFSIWWGGEVSQELGVQSADVSALPGVLPPFKQVSSFLSKSLDHRGQKVCGCVPVAILISSPLLNIECIFHLNFQYIAPYILLQCNVNLWC